MLVVSANTSFSVANKFKFSDEVYILLYFIFYAIKISAKTTPPTIVSGAIG
jgi:hypothetical protein